MRIGNAATNVNVIVVSKKKIVTRSARMRALFGVPTPMAISFTPDESNLALDSFKVEASSQLEI